MKTLEKLQQHLSHEPKRLGFYFDGEPRMYKDVTQRVACGDGSTMSVQASECHYSTPRSNYGPYSHVEVWCCGQVDAWSEYGTGEEPYAYVPIELVAEEIDRRGGFKE